MRKRKVLALFVALTMVLSCFSMSFAGTESGVDVPASVTFNDVNGHWASDAIYRWSGNGVINGSEGLFRPDDQITRGEMAVILDNMMNYQAASKNTFTDLKSGQFYTDAVLKANAAGIMKGDGTSVRPADKISREEAIVMLARAFAVKVDDGSTASFNDTASISSWAMDYIAAMKDKGYVKGTNGSFLPKASITRAEVVTLIDNIVKAYYTVAGTYTDNVNGTVVIKVPDVILKGTVISENLIIAEGVGEGDVTLDSVTVKGDTVIRGGGENSIHITGTSSLTSVILEKVDGKIRVTISDGLTVKVLEAAVGEEIFLSGSVGTLNITGDDLTVNAVDANIDTANLTGNNSKIIVDADSKISTVNASAKTSISGKGTVTTLKMNKGADNSSVTTPNTKTIVASGVSGVTGGGGKSIPAGRTGTNNSSSTDLILDGQTTGGGGGGGGSHDNETVSPKLTFSPTAAGILINEKIGNTNGVIGSYFNTTYINPIEISLLKGSIDYQNVRVVVEGVTNGGIQLIVLDTNGDWVDIVQTGWGPSDGFVLADSATPVYVVANTVGTYDMTIKLINVTDNTVLASTTAKITAGDMGDEDSITVLRPFTLVGAFDGNTINSVKISKLARSFKWIKEADEFEEVVTNSSSMVGNFVMLLDIDHDGDENSDNDRAEGILIVSAEDSETFWDANLDTFDEINYSADNKIPYGERLYEGYGLSGAVTDFGNVEGSEYWSLNDFYNIGSSETLTMLTGYQTIQQTAGWTCGPASALSVLEWFGMRNDLNEMDLAALRQKDEPGATDLQEMRNIFKGLNAIAGEPVWQIDSTADLAENEGGLVEGNYNYLMWQMIPEYLKQGIPVMVGWDAFGGHWQVIIGFDDMGTKNTNDDVLILMDPYDSTDHNQDGYTIQSYERFVYDWSSNFDENFKYGIFVAAYPANWDYTPKKGTELVDDEYNNTNISDKYKIPYGNTADSIDEHYPGTEYRGLDGKGLAGAATEGYERSGDHPISPYYKHPDIYNISDDTNPSLTILENFQTIQQATEWTCGPASALMVLNWYGAKDGLNEIDLALLREKDEPGATDLQQLINIFDNLNADGNYEGPEWDYESTYDLAVEEYPDSKYIQDCLEEGRPIMVGWHEWGGHWQVIIGYDDMGTKATADDVLILADPYDTTDHNQDGYLIESYERLFYDWANSFDPEFSNYVFLTVYPDAS